MQLKKIKNFFIKESNNFSLSLTNSAVNQILYLIKNNSDMLGLRISIKKSGCAGFTYVIEKATQISDEDYIYEKNGAKLFVSMKSILLINGTELDYVQEGLNYVFKFNNPKANHICGCGDSFSV